MISPVHMNSNLVCSIDTETTGLDFVEHEILQLCILPLNSDYTLSKKFPYLHLKIKPRKLDPKDENTVKFNKKLIVDCLNYGMDKDRAQDKVMEWFQSLKLAPRKQIVPLGCNYDFDRDFIMDFMGGPLNYNYVFRSDVRDVQRAALHHNDMADFRSEQVPFAKYSLGALCSRLHIPHPNAHDAVADALATAEAYRRILRFGAITNRNPPNLQSSVERGSYLSSLWATY